MPLAYIAEPIDFRNLADDGVQVQFAKRICELRNQDWVLYSPHGTFSIKPGVKPGPAVYNINQTALAAADLLIALVDGRSIGVPAEIQTAIDHGTLVECYTTRDIAAKSWQLAGWNQYGHFEVHTEPELGGI